MSQANFYQGPIPSAAGIGLRTAHYQHVLASKPPIAWFEVHSENYFAAGGKNRYYLEQIRRDYPFSFHGVGLSLGSSDELNRQHLQQLKKLIADFSPALVSEHLCWSAFAGQHLHDLLPLPYTPEAIEHFAIRVSQAQEFLGRQILIENVSTYLQFNHSTLTEAEFLVELVQRTGCGILLDINNLYVNSQNHQWDANAYLQTIPRGYVHEMHLAGFTEKQVDAGTTILIDTHSQPVTPAVWELYAQAVQRFGKVPTLIEWDKEIPEFQVLWEHAQQANRIMESYDVVAA